MTELITIVRIAGDGVGPELVDSGSRVLESLGLPITWIDADAGLTAYQRHGTTAPQETLDALRTHGLAIKGPFRTPSGGTIRSGNHYIRHGLDLYACLRPLPIRRDRPPMLLVRENTEDLYGAIEWMASPDVAQAVKIASRSGCERIVRYAFELARRERRAKVTLVHKANNLKLTEGLFLSTAREVAVGYPDIAFDDVLSDTAAALMVREPERLDVVVTNHTVGDILSSLGAALAGSLGVVGSLDSGPGVHIAEGCHGDAGDLAGTGTVNPAAFFEGIVLLLDTMNAEREAARLRTALTRLRTDGPRAHDLGGSSGTAEITDFVCAEAAAS
ncbi:isocitrate/isopropylmalate family dehydrogenase [Kitasatospora sp. NPDC058048]|uniref:isocitrate/isopropylmalate family dehydrogenase n=1 Tax=Kitasatospora sp. NPDC058048 TaxID=3346313 RepID=UPI0036DE8250